MCGQCYYYYYYYYYYNSRSKVVVSRKITALPPVVNQRLMWDTVLLLPKVF